jgi:crotonobetainyl-CoA:carnitine CoA-transferase CaiB-like acyl-CoA transferase
MSYEAPFAGLRVVDLSQGVAGPYAAMLLAQYGAGVVKVEPPEGDWARTLGRRHGDHSAFSLAANLGKRAIVLDLKEERGMAVLRRLVERADVFLESFRPGVAERLGIGYDAVAALAPRIVYVSVSGFGQTGPDAERPAVDTVLQAFTGLMSVNRGNDGVPHRVGAVVMDMATALCTFQALAVALYARRDAARGCHIQSTLLGGGATLQTVSLIAHHLEAGKPQPGLTPSGTFAARDGWINVSILRDADFGALCDALEIPQAKSDPRFSSNARRFENVDALTPLLVGAFATRTVEEWAERLRGAQIMHQKVNDYIEFLRHPQVEATGAIAWLDQPGVGPIPIPNVPGVPPLVSGSARAAAPSLDQHRKEILAEVGCEGLWQGEVGGDDPGRGRA